MLPLEVINNKIAEPINYYTHWMKLALDLAERNLGKTHENPSVGAVIVKNNQLISYGITAAGGRPHAETIAIKQASKEQLQQADLFVTLEPCCHYGQTSPCTDLIIQSGIKRVIVPSADPDFRVSGTGIKILQENGIEVITSILEPQAYKINRGFIFKTTKNRPFITVKMAVTLDGKIACHNYSSKWLSNELARKFAHYLRLKSDAILVGKNTYKHDKPALTCRLHGIEDKKLLRVILDRSLSNEYPEEKDLLIYTQKSANQSNILTTASDEEYIEFILSDLAKKGINNLLVEGGGNIATSLMEEKLIDQLILIRVPIILGNDAIPMTENLKLNEVIQATKLKYIESFKLLDNNVEIFEF